MKVAVAGCCHGALDKMYETLQFLEQRHGQARPDLLLCAGDFQAVRNAGDLRCMAVPAKYRQLGEFARYYSGEKKAPVLTIFIGGNHEASNHLQELPYGGWVAPNIYYLGYAGVVKYRGVRIGGLSGIFKSHDYRKGHFECPPYNQHTVRSVYHVRNIEVFKLKQANGSGQQPKETKFLALDKCLPHRDFLQIVEIPHDPNAPDHLEYDPEWIAVLKATNNLINVSPNLWNMPENNGLHAKWDYSVSEDDTKEVLEEANRNLQIPHNFSAMVPSQQQTEPVHRINPQTTEFCAQFGLTDINYRIQQLREQILKPKDEEEEEEEVDSSGSAEDPSDYNTDTSALSLSVNPDEIILDEDSADEDLEPSSVEPSADRPDNISTTFSEVRILPDSMTVSPNDTVGTADEELEKSNESSQAEEQSLSEKLLKRISGENEESSAGPKRIKRRNQAIYASKDEDEVE
nr:lariat debranching enzyme isoform X2 [Pogona vitticeps]